MPSEVVVIPIDFCSIFKGGTYRVRMPFGLPPFTAADPFALMAQLNTFLASLSPFLNIVGCFFKLISFVKAVPNPFAMGAALAALATCFGVTIPSYALITPSAIIQMLQFLVDMLTLIIVIMQFLITQITVINSGLAAISTWTTLPDMTSQASCTQTQVNSMQNDLGQKLASIEGIITILNVILLLVGQQPIDVTIPGSDATIEALQGIIDTLTPIRDALASIPGVGL